MKRVAKGATKLCTSCNGYHGGSEFKTCNRCLMSRKDKTLLRLKSKDATKLESRKGKKLSGTKNWCLIADFNQDQSICRPCLEKNRTIKAAKRTAKKKLAKNTQLTKALTELSHQAVTMEEQHTGPNFPVVQCVRSCKAMHRLWR